MQLETFMQSFEAQTEAPDGLSELLLALWKERKGDWTGAHELAQRNEGSQAQLVHAYLHRREGDLSNADYWYSKASQSRPAVSMDEEWHNLVRLLLNDT